MLASESGINVESLEELQLQGDECAAVSKFCCSFVLLSGVWSNGGESSLGAHESEINHVRPRLRASGRSVENIEIPLQ